MCELFASFQNTKYFCISKYFSGSQIYFCKFHPAKHFALCSLPELHGDDVPGGDERAVVARQLGAAVPAEPRGAGAGAVIHRQPVVAAARVLLQVELAEGEAHHLIVNC